MFENILLYTSVISLIIYIYYLNIFLKGLSATNHIIGYDKKKVSVVVAARNEEQNISNLLTALVNQSYPQELYEIIIADDDSSDDTVSIIRQFAMKWSNINIIKVQNRDKVVSHKKNALSQAIEASSNDIILSTDADCIVGRYWIESMVSNFEDNTSMVVGFSRTQIQNWKNPSFIGKFEHFDFIALFTAAAGAISAGKIFSCSGQNIAYKKKDFERIGKFEKIKHIISGDDVNLMQLMRKHGMKVRFSFLHHSFVYTKPVTGFIQFLNQRSRWASNSKWQLLLNPEFFIYLVSVFFVTILPFIILFYSWWLGALLIIIKAFLDHKIIKKGFSIFLIEKQKLKFFPAWFLIQPVYIIMVGIIGQLNVFSWKK